MIVRSISHKLLENLSLTLLYAISAVRSWDRLLSDNPQNQLKILNLIGLVKRQGNLLLRRMLKSINDC